MWWISHISKRNETTGFYISPHVGGLLVGIDGTISYNNTLFIQVGWNFAILRDTQTGQPTFTFDLGILDGGLGISFDGTLSPIFRPIPTLGFSFTF